MPAKPLLALLLSLPFALVAAADAPLRADRFQLAGDAKGIPVRTLVEQAQAFLGEPLFYEPRDLEEANLDLLGAVDVPREAFLAFFEHALASVEMVHFEREIGGVRTHRLMKLGLQARSQPSMKTMARVVTTEELAAMAGRRLLVTTVYESTNAPARELVTTMNLYFPDAVTDSIRNIEGTDQIVMTGFSDHVARCIALMQRIDAATSDDREFAAYRDLQRRVEALEKQLAAAKPAAPGGAR